MSFVQRAERTRGFICHPSGRISVSGSVSTVQVAVLLFVPAGDRVTAVVLVYLNWKWLFFGCTRSKQQPLSPSSPGTQAQFCQTLSAGEAFVVTGDLI